MEQNYQAARTKEYILKLRELQKELPLVCGSYFRSLENYTSPLTRYAYAVDLKGFFRFLTTETEELLGKNPKSLTAADLALVKPYHIEIFLDSVSYYVKDDREYTNMERAKARKLATVRSFFKYLFKAELIPSNVAALVDMPKLHEKAIIRLDANEVASLIDHAENGEGLTARQQAYHASTSIRDTAILSLFLGTGIRISELVGINLNDVDFDSNTFLVTRKGGKQALLAFNDEVAGAMLAYRAERLETVPIEGHEQAFFLSMQRRRITPRAVENLVKKYASVTTPLKKITPHKLRSTYGTMLYRETGDIYLVADVLGHKDVNTTRKHYAAQAEDHARMAAEAIRLRDDPEQVEPVEESEE